MTAPMLMFDLDKLIVSRLLVQANSGGGKSHAIRYLLETTHGRIQHIVIDREGEFSTLRAKFPYLLVGPEGEVAADIRGAKLLARKVMELNLSAVLDLSELSLGQQREYVGTFIGAINHLPRALWKDCLIVIDEAHLFAPEKGKGESAARDAISILLSTGRKRGYCAVLATQRLAKLDKDVAAECLNKLIGRTSNEDVKRAGEELAFDRSGARDLRTLEPGDFWAYGPAIAVEPVLVRTGKVQTRPPERGALRQPAPPTPAAISAIAAALADLPREADAEARTMADAQRKIRELEAQLRRAEKGTETRTIEKSAVDQAAVTRAVDRALADAARAYERKQKQQAATVRQLVGNLTKVGTQLVLVAGNVNDAIGNTARGLEELVQTNGHVPAVAAPREARLVPAPAQRAAVERRVRAESTDPSLPAGERAVLVAIAQNQDGATREQVSILSGYKTSTRNAYIQRLEARGYVLVRGDTVVATGIGIEALGDDFEPLPTGEALRDYWLARLPEGEAKVLQAVIDAHPDAISRDQVSELTGYKTSTRNAYLQRLGTRKLIQTRGSDVIASPILFEES